MNKSFLSLPLPEEATSRDIHICGGCKLHFNNVKSFFVHKRECNSEIGEKNVENVNSVAKYPTYDVISTPTTLENLSVPCVSSASVAQSSRLKKESTPTCSTGSLPSSTVTKRFHCEVASCQYKTCYLKDLQRHRRTHTGERPFSCTVCGKDFNRADKLKTHERSHTGDKPFKCTECDYATNDSSSLKKHLRIHSGERPFKCQICPYASRNSSQLVVHLRTHTGDSPFHCPVCNTKFKINSDLKRHMRMHTGEKPYACQLCDYKCTIKGNLKTHMKLNHSTDNEQKCPHCDFVTSSRRAFREHEKTHDTKAMRCVQCSYSCTTKAALKNHLRVHSNERPFKCEFCSYASRQPGNVRTHTKKLHLEKLQRQKRNSKKDCGSPSGAADGNNSSLTHKRSRTRPICNRSFNCTLCEASFVREDSLRSHLRQHQERLKQLEGAATIAVLQLSNPVVANSEMTAHDDPGSNPQRFRIDALKSDPIITTSTTTFIEQALQQSGVIGSSSTGTMMTYSQQQISPQMITYIQNSQQDGLVDVPGSSSILATLLKGNQQSMAPETTQILTMDEQQMNLSPATATTATTSLGSINLGQSMSSLTYSLGLVPLLSVSGQSVAPAVPTVSTSVATLVPDQGSAGIQYIVHASPDGTGTPVFFNQSVPTALDGHTLLTLRENQRSVEMVPQRPEVHSLLSTGSDDPSLLTTSATGFLSSAGLPFLTPILMAAPQTVDGTGSGTETEGLPSLLKIYSIEHSVSGTEDGDDDDDRRSSVVDGGQSA